MILIEAVGLIVLGLCASLVGSLLGLGGGLIIMPVLTVLFKIPVHTAIGASLVTVITTSTITGATAARAEMTNIRLAMLLEIATTTGAILGAFLSLLLGLNVLAFVMFVVLLASAYRMSRPDPGSVVLAGDASLRRKERMEDDPLAHRLRLSSSYHDESLGRQVSYAVTNTHVGLLLSAFAGAVSGLLGIGGGVIKVPAMSGIMRVPIKVASATSNLMIGVTACASASVFYMHGSIDALLTSLLMLGVVPGSVTGMSLGSKAPRKTLRKLFVFILVAVAFTMVLKGIGVIA